MNQPDFPILISFCAACTVILPPMQVLLDQQPEDEKDKVYCPNCGSNVTDRAARPEGTFSRAEGCTLLRNAHGDDSI